MDRPPRLKQETISERWPRAITNSQTKLVSRDFATNIKECSTLLLGLLFIKYVSKPLQE